jgi:erythromycin esterase
MILLTTLVVGEVVAQAAGTPADETTPLTLGQVVERTVEGGGLHLYHVTLTEGQFARFRIKERGGYLSIIARDPAGAFLLEDHRVNASGTKAIEFVAKTSGSYRFGVMSIAMPTTAGHYELRFAEALSAEQHAAYLRERETASGIVTEWVANGLVPLRSIAPGMSFDDLDHLKRTLRDVRVVGLGESTHGTREFFQVKHRLLEFLVREMGFTALALESDAASCAPVNAYVLGADGETKEVLKSLYRIWQTEEMAALVDWMRAHNRAASQERSVRFLCFDVQGALKSVDHLLGYLARVDSSRAVAATGIRKSIAETRSPAFDGDEERAKASMERLETALAGLDALRDHLLANRREFARRTSTAALDSAMRALELARQGVDVSASKSVIEFSATRDAYMARNVERVIQGEPGARIVLWAHNSHVLPGTGIGKNLGTLLRESLGQRYYALGFFFGEGEFTASDRADAKQALRQFSAGAPAAQSLEWYLARPAKGNYILDLRHAPKSVADWLRSTIGARFADATFSDDQLRSWADLNQLWKLDPSESLDGIVFVDRTTGARRF